MATVRPFPSWSVFERFKHNREAAFVVSQIFDVEGDDSGL